MRSEMVFVCDICGENVAYAYVVNGSDEAKYFCPNCYLSLMRGGEMDE